LIQPDFIRVRTFAMHRKSPMQKMVENGTFVPMTDEEIIREIRLLLVNLNKMPQLFQLRRSQPDLLMHVNGYLDESKEPMLKDLMITSSFRKSRTGILAFETRLLRKLVH